MRKTLRRPAFIVAVFTLLGQGPTQSHIAAVQQFGGPSLVGGAIAGSPILFQPNQGQFAPDVRFAASTGKARLFLMPTGAAVSTMQRNRAQLVRWTYLGANPVTIGGQDPQRATFNYLYGRDKTKWHTRIPSYGRVRYADLYPGIDAIYYTAAERLEVDFVVRPGASPWQIVITFDPGSRLHVNESGALIIETAASQLTFEAPTVYQDTNDGRRYVRGSYELTGNRRVGFAIGAYDRRVPLVIDPVITTASLFGGGFADGAGAVAVDREGFLYMGGETMSPDIPLERPVDEMPNESEGFVAMFTPDAKELVFATYFGGIAHDRVSALAVDGSRNIYLAGRTASPDFPTINALKSTFVSGTCPIAGPILGFPAPVLPCTDAFAAKLAPDGASLVYSTYLGGSHSEEAFGVAVDSTGAAYVAGETFSPDFVMSAGAADAAFTESGCGNEFQSRRCEEGFVVKLSPAGNSAVYATYIGGRRLDEINDIAVDQEGRAYVTGTTSSEDFPLVHAFQSIRHSHQCAQNFSQCFDGFAARLNAAGSSFEYSTYLSGGGRDYGLGIAVDVQGSAYVVGSTESHSFPVANAWQPNLKPLPAGSGSCLSGLVNPPACPDGFVTRLTTDGSSVIFSTFLGGTGIDDIADVALDVLGNPYIVGTTSSSDFPTVNAYQVGYGGGTNDAFVAMMTTSGAILGYSSFLGGSGNDSGLAIDVDALGYAIVGGVARAGFPTTEGAFQRAESGDSEAFIARVSPAWASRVAVRDAGNDHPGTPAVDTYGTRTSIGTPLQVATDMFGNRYFADASNHRVYKVGLNNRIILVAGNGTAGFSGDLGPASEAALNAPAGVAVDATGNLYIADSGNHRIRMIRAVDQEIVTIAGTGVPGYGGDMGPSVDATLAFPLGVSVTGDKLYIADTYNHRIREVGSDGLIRTVAGNGIAVDNGDGEAATSASLNTPTAVAADGGHLVIASWGGHRVRIVTGGVITTIAGTGVAGFFGDGGAAILAQLNGPFGVAIASGRVYIADQNNHRIRMVHASGTITTIVGNGTPGNNISAGAAASIQLAFPVGVATDSFDNLFVSDVGNARLLRIFRVSGLP